jgi:oligopeptide transport system substrate-binding protein
MLAGLAACGGEMGTGSAANTLQRGLPSDPETLDHHKARSTQAAEVLRDLGEGLAGFTANGELIPAAAESWDISDDGLTRSTLRPACDGWLTRQRQRSTHK